MHFTTQKQQQKEYRRVLKEERIALCKRVVKTLSECAVCLLVIILPVIGAALGWIKD
jgi:hypothetical protein